ncbi:MAG: HEAT repeat domain-containing protein [Candidatus Heimdallarchaeota archaeon]|nr:HEAT repeat domain-containing protein [Candidatus Heimdallarchaeota archaeon]
MSNIENNDSNEMNVLRQVKEQLKSNNSNDRFEAIHIIRKEKFLESIDILENLVEYDSEIAVRELALIVLFELQAPEIFSLVKKIFYNTTESRFMRGRAIWILGHFRDQQSFELLKLAIEDSDEEVLYWAIMGLLGNSSYQQIIPKINILLQSNRSSLVRQTAAWLLGMKYELESREILERSLLHDEHYTVRMISAWSLSRINDIKSLTNLSKALQKDTNELTRREIAFSIGNITNGQNDETRLTSEFLTQNDLAIRSLTRVLQRDTSYIVRRACAEALGQLGDKRAVPSLIETLSLDTNQFVRKEIIITLGKIGDEQAIEIINNAKRSHYKMIEEAAIEALEKLNKK